MEKMIKGVICAMVTPMKNDESINYNGIRKLVDHSIRSGVHGVFTLGTTGEFFSLTTKEKEEIVKTVMEETAGRVPVYAGCGGVSTHEVINLAQRMEALGVDAISVVTPFFVSPSQSELYRHYERIAAATSLPVILYNIPARTGVHLEADTVTQLSEIDNIAGIKDSSGNFENIRAYREKTGKDFAVLAGTDSLILKSLEIGANGAIAATANVVPKVVAGIYESFMSGDLESAARFQELLGPLRDSFKLGTVPSILKEATNIIGIDAGPPRGPLERPTGETLEKLKSVILENYSQYLV